MKGYKIWFRSSGVNKAYIYCIAENEDKAIEYFVTSADEDENIEIIKTKEVHIEYIPLKDLSAGDLIRLFKHCMSGK